MIRRIKQEDLAKLFLNHLFATEGAKGDFEASWFVDGATSKIDLVLESVSDRATEEEILSLEEPLRSRFRAYLRTLLQRPR